MNSLPGKLLVKLTVIVFANTPGQCVLAQRSRVLTAKSPPKYGDILSEVSFMAVFLFIFLCS